MDNWLLDFFSSTWYLSSYRRKESRKWTLFLISDSPISRIKSLPLWQKALSSKASNKILWRKRPSIKRPPANNNLSPSSRNYLNPYKRQSRLVLSATSNWNKNKNNLKCEYSTLVSKTTPIISKSSCSKRNADKKISARKYPLSSTIMKSALRKESRPVNSELPPIELSQSLIKNQKPSPVPISSTPIERRIFTSSSLMIVSSKT